MTLSGYQLLKSDIHESLAIHDDNILNPCTSFPLGIKVGDRIEVVGPNGTRTLSTVLSMEEWTKDTANSRGTFTDKLSICAKDDAPYNNECVWRNDWSSVVFIERPAPIEEDGQLLMF